MDNVIIQTLEAKSNLSLSGATREPLWSAVSSTDLWARLRLEYGQRDYTNLGSEIKSESIRSHQGASLVSLVQHRPQGKVEHVSSCVVLHDRTTTTL